MRPIMIVGLAAAFAIPKKHRQGLGRTNHACDGKIFLAQARSKDIQELPNTTEQTQSRRSASGLVERPVRLYCNEHVPEHLHE